MHYYIGNDQGLTVVAPIIGTFFWECHLLGTRSNPAVLNIYSGEPGGACRRLWVLRVGFTATRAVPVVLHERKAGATASPVRPRCYTRPVTGLIRAFLSL